MFNTISIFCLIALVCIYILDYFKEKKMYKIFIITIFLFAIYANSNLSKNIDNSLKNPFIFVIVLLTIFTLFLRSKNI